VRIGPAIERLVSAGAIASVLVVGLDVPSILGRLLVLAFLLLGPGAALSLHLGPLAPEVRALVSVIGSLSIATLSSLALIYIDLWSPELGVAAIALIAQTLVIAAPWYRAPRRHDPTSDTDVDPSDPIRAPESR
jgi:hypothetical protein